MEELIADNQRVWKHKLVLVVSQEGNVLKRFYSDVKWGTSDSGDPTFLVPYGDKDHEAIKVVNKDHGQPKEYYEIYI